MQDDSLLAVNKPAGVLTIPDRAGEISLREVISSTLGITDDLRLVHRLDRDTSGVLLLVKTLHAQRELSRQFRNRLVVKTYLAIVRGTPPGESGMIDAPLAPHPKMPSRTIVPRKKGRPSQTGWEVVDRYRDFALLRCRPLTGRQHQIRVHLAHIGLPLLVDEVYGQKAAFHLSEVKSNYRQKRWRDERPLMGRLSLHAESLSFDHPDTGQRVELVASCPKDFSAVINQLGKWAGHGSAGGS